MDHGLDYGGQLQACQELQLLDRPAPQRQNQQEQDCYQTEGDDNFKVLHIIAARVVVSVTVWVTPWGGCSAERAQAHGRGRRVPGSVAGGHTGCLLACCPAHFIP